MMTAPRIGFFGKLPAHGDFIDRGLPRSFIAPWDHWLQEVLANSRELLGATWLDHYLVGPIWRFALTPELCGACGWRGIMLPSVDRVNRYFPLTIAVPERPDLSPLAALTGGAAWFEAVEAAALEALNPKIDADALDTLLQAIPSPKAACRHLRSPRVGLEGASAWRLSLSATDPVDLEAAVAETLLKQGYPRASLWWSTGGEHMGPGLLIHRGLPSIHDFAALLDGQWTRWGWASCEIETAPAADPGGIATAAPWAHSASGSQPDPSVPSDALQPPASGSDR
jgi:type VI secretion system protein ImpM